MKTTILSKVLIVLLCSVSFITTHAQGLSLSFNLTENDKLENMIADSKKYEISALTLSGYVNDANVKYIQDLNMNGVLLDLDLSKVIDIDVFYEDKASYITSSNSNAMEWLRNNGFFLNEQNRWGLYSWDERATKQFEYKDVYHKDCITRSFYLSRGEGNNNPVNIPYSEQYPKLIFQNCVFNNFVLPETLKSVGDDDCSFRVNSCNVMVIGDNLKTIGKSAFKGSHIGVISTNAIIDSIKANAFEKATGNILSVPQFVENAVYIGKSAFASSNLLENTECELILKVMKIGSCAFNKAIISNTVLLSQVQEIGDSAFMASSIKELELNDNIKDIGNSVFEECEDLTMFKGGQGINTIGIKTFYGCKHLKEFIPSNTLKSIGDRAFANTTSMLEFSIPDATKVIGYGALANSGIKELDLGKYENFHRDLIVGCDSLEIISVNKSNEKLISERGILFSKDKSRIIAYPCAKKDAIFEIPNSVIEIADSAFYDVNKLGALVISEKVSKIGKNAFGNSSVLELKVLPSTTPKVTDNISGLDQSLVRLFVHEKDYSTYYIANYWGDFKNIFVLEKTVSPDNLINVEVAGTLPNYIGFGNQFKYNSLRLSGKLNGDDVRYLREMAGRDVNGKETAGVLTNLDFSQASIVKGGDCYYKKNEYSSGKLTTAENEIGESLFEGCKFTNLAISESTTKIGNRAFSGCSSLSSFAFGSSVKTIGQEAFSDCTAMTHLISKATTPPTCGTQALDDINKWNCTLSVPEGCNSVYQQADQWKDFFFIDNDISGINSLAINKNLSVKSRYTLNGQQVSKPQRGLNIVRMSNGTTRKVVVK